MNARGPAHRQCESRSGPPAESKKRAHHLSRWEGTDAQEAPSLALVVRLSDEPINLNTRVRRCVGAVRARAAETEPSPRESAVWGLVHSWDELGGTGWPPTKADSASQPLAKAITRYAKRNPTGIVPAVTDCGVLWRPCGLTGAYSGAALAAEGEP